MRIALRAYGAALATLVLLDGAWLGFIARDFYQTQLGPLVADQVRWGAGLLFYLAYPAGLVALALSPRPARPAVAVGRAALVGAMSYGTYDLTNMATLAGWSSTLTVVDMLWGVSISAAAGAAAWWASGRRGP